MLIIMSGTYAVDELRSEFGDIPPTFLPIGNKRLYKHQHELVKDFYNKILITLPEDFEVSQSDKQALSDLKISIEYLNPKLSLGASLSEVLNKHNLNDSVDILFGDTLFGDFTRVVDSIWVSHKKGNYNWHSDGNDIWAGFFSFSNAKVLAGFLKNNLFHDAVETYSKEYKYLDRVRVKSWYDFGHLNTYFQSKQQMTTERHFNSLNITDGIVHKQSMDGTKMDGEASWYENTPASLKPFLPQFIQRDGAGEKTKGYSIEYLPMASISELFVFGRLDEDTWSDIFDSCSDFLEKASKVVCKDEMLPNEYNRQTYYNKTLARLEDFSMDSGISLDHEWTINGQISPSIRTVLDSVWAKIEKTPPKPSFIHGDFCFSNILYDFRSNRIKTLDPRGIDANRVVSCFGDARYDIAKLAHSAIGLYDFIIAGQYILDQKGYTMNFSFKESSNYIDGVGRMFWNAPFWRMSFDPKDVQSIVVTLFLSMVPLHKDSRERQMAFLANAFRLYRGLEL